MSRRDPTQEAFREIAELREQPPLPEGIARLKHFLSRKSNHVVGRAAAVAELWDARELLPDLERAFNRFLSDAAKSDPGCVAKLNAAGALLAFDHAAPELYLAGARHVQREPVFGGSEDTAPALRATCGRALAAINHPEAWYILADLLADPEPECRRITVETLAQAGTTAAELLLRMRALTPGEEPDITAACLAGLVQIDPKRSFDFVVRFLDHEPAVMEGAALALGESKLPEALQVLVKYYRRHAERSRQKAFLLPIALLRSEDSFDFLLGVIREDSVPLAAAALRALAIYPAEPTRIDRIRVAVETRGAPELVEIVDDLFSDARNR